MTVNRSKFVSYLRISTKSQQISGLGLDGQRESVRKFLGGLEPVAEFVETESGKKTDLNRPELAKAFRMCRVHGATLVVSRLDRLARNAHFLLGLRDAGIEFVCCDMPTMNRLTVGIMAMVAEEEARLISVRTKAALAAAKKRGVKLGKNNLTHAGQIKGSINANEQRIELANQRAIDLIQTIDNVKESGITTYAGIANELNRLDIPTAYRPGVSVWHACTVRNLVMRANRLR